VAQSKRGPVAIGALAAGVVAVLGFGSGLGLVTPSSSTTPSSAASGPSSTQQGRNLGTVVQAPPSESGAGSTGGVSTGGGVATSGGGGGAASADSVAASGDASTSQGTTGSGTSASAGTTATAGTTPTSGGTTSDPMSAGGTVAVADQSCAPALSAILAPFVSHVERGHLEEPLPSQVGDILNLGQYVSTHTALAESMLAPLFSTVLNVLSSSLAPFVAHVEKGHLQEPIASQVGDILNVGQYVTTHTVLVSQMLTPVFQAVTC